MTSSTPLYKTLVSRPTTIRLTKTGQEMVYPGYNIIIGASISHISGIPTGCVSNYNVSMISNFMYYDFFENETVQNKSFIGLYDPNIIETNLKNIIRPYAIESLNKQKITQPTPEQIENKTIQLMTTFSSDAKSKISPVSLAYRYSILKDVLSFVDSNAIKHFRNQFLNCPSDQFFFIPLITVPFLANAIQPNHANGIFISKAKGTVFRIEPQYSSELNKEREDLIDKGVLDLVDKIGLKNPTLKKITVDCPQSVVQDNNCVFWSTMIFEEVLKNMYKKDINSTIQELTSKSKEELNDLIYKYKTDLFSNKVPLILKEWEVQWPDYENNKNKILDEINMDHVRRPGMPLQSRYKIGVGRKTYRKKGIKRTKKSKNQRIRQ